jgi:hypothetical protein
VVDLLKVEREARVEPLLSLSLSHLSLCPERVGKRERQFWRI